MHFYRKGLDWLGDQKSMRKNIRKVDKELSVISLIMASLFEAMAIQDGITWLIIVCTAYIAVWCTAQTKTKGSAVETAKPNDLHTMNLTTRFEKTQIAKTCR